MLLMNAMESLQAFTEPDNDQPAELSVDMLLKREPWQEEAACSEASWELFFGPDAKLHRESKNKRLERESQAKSFCQNCPVQDECLESSFKHNDQYGIWGGLNPEERARLRNLF